MARHSAGPSAAEAAPAARTRSGSLGPVTDPLLLDAVEQQLHRLRATPRAPVAASPAPAPAPAPIQRRPAPREWHPAAVDDHTGGVPLPAQPRSAPRGTRIPMEFGEVDDPFEVSSATVMFTDGQRVLAPASDRPRAGAPLTAATPAADPFEHHAVAVGSAPAVVEGPPATSNPIPVATGMRVSEPRARAAAGADKERSPLVFWIVFGTAVVAVLTVVALLPY